MPNENLLPFAIHGQLIEIGDDDDGQPRLVVQTTREAIKACDANLLLKPVVVALQGATEPPAFIVNAEDGSVTRAYPTVYDEVIAERVRQDRQWGGSENDNANTFADWLKLIDKQASYAALSHYPIALNYRERMVKIAALAVAAIESLDRTMVRGAEAG